MINYKRDIYKPESENISEVCPCIDCHEADAHKDDLVRWAKDCGACDMDLESAIENKEYCAICQVWWCNSHL